MMMRWRNLAVFVAMALVLVPPARAGERLYGIAMHGEPALPRDFSHFPYVNPDAPKGGSYREAIVGTFDSLNPFIVKGQPIYGLRSYVFESLLARSTSEAFTLYPLIARSLEVPADRGSVTFHLDERAHFSDGVPITAKDVVFSWRTLRDKGRPNYRSYYSKITSVETPDDHTVTFRLDRRRPRACPHPRLSCRCCRRISTKRTSSTRPRSTPSSVRGLMW